MILVSYRSFSRYSSTCSVSSWGKELRNLNPSFFLFCSAGRALELNIFLPIPSLECWNPSYLYTAGSREISRIVFKIYFSFLLKSSFCLHFDVLNLIEDFIAFSEVFLAFPASQTPPFSVERAPYRSYKISPCHFLLSQSMAPSSNSPSSSAILDPLGVLCPSISAYPSSFNIPNQCSSLCSSILWSFHRCHHFQGDFSPWVTIRDRRRSTIAYSIYWHRRHVKLQLSRGWITTGSLRVGLLEPVN